MGDLTLGINTLYMLSCFLKQFALVGKGLNGSMPIVPALTLSDGFKMTSGGGGMYIYNHGCTCFCSIGISRNFTSLEACLSEDAKHSWP